MKDDDGTTKLRLKEAKLKGKNGIYRRGEVYIAVVEGPRDSKTNRRRRVWLRERFRTRREAEKARDKLRDQIRGGIGVKPEKLSVAEVVTRYVDHRVALGKVGQKQSERYRQLLRLNIEPHIGSIKIRSLHKSHVSALITTLLATGKQRRKDGSARPNTGLSPTTVHHVHMLLKSALAWAISVDIILRNPADIDDGPQRAKNEANALTDEELGRLLVAVRASRWEPLLLFALSTGLRRGELAALSRANVHLVTSDDTLRGTVSVKASMSQTKAAGVTLKGTKTGRVRHLPLSPMACTALQAQDMVRSQDEFSNQGAYKDDGFVFADPVGRGLSPFAVTDAFRKLARKAGVSKRLHDLRHHAVSNLLAAGVDVVTVASIAGHSSVQTTLSTYSHLLVGMKELAMAKLDDRLRAAIDRDEERRGQK